MCAMHTLHSDLFDEHCVQDHVPDAALPLLNLGLLQVTKNLW